MADVKARQEWLKVLSGSLPDELAMVADPIIATHAGETSDLRRPEIGLVLTSGRVSGVGDPFGVGESTVTRCVVQVGSVMGVGYVFGRDRAHARRVAILDALLQTEDLHDIVMTSVVHEMALLRHQRHQSSVEDVAASRVHFLTMVRGD